MDLHSLLQEAISAASGASEVVRRHYKTESSDRRIKDDGSPVTVADTESHEHLTAALIRVKPQFPIISEEGGIPDYSIRKEWTAFWIIDPLDGTKDYLKRNGQFTVNVALVHAGEPVLGVIIAPEMNVTYYAAKGHGAWKQEGNHDPVRIFSRLPTRDESVILVESRSHPDPRLEYYLAEHKIGERLKVGSSLKFCLVAEGKAHLYPRFGGINEWDAAAGDCIYRNSSLSGVMDTGLIYNKPTMRHSDFLIGWNPSKTSAN